MSDNGSERQNLSRRAKEDGPPVWSPDGTRIAFAGVRGGKAGIYIVAADGSGTPLRVKVPDLQGDAIDWTGAER